MINYINTMTFKRLLVYWAVTMIDCLIELGWNIISGKAALDMMREGDIGDYRTSDSQTISVDDYFAG